MSFTLAGQPAARGIAIGRAVLAPSSRLDVAHDFITPAQVPAELARLAAARKAVAARLQRLRADMPRDTPAELSAMLDVHLMMLLDEVMAAETARWVRERHYNAEWAIATQLEVLSRQFDEMEDAYLRERKADVAQVAARLLRELRGVPASPLSAPAPLEPADNASAGEADLVLIAPDLAPADMLQFKKRVFAGFATDEGSSASHTAIVARSLDIPSVVGAGQASQRIRQDDVLIIDGDAGLIHVNPDPAMLAEYRKRRQQAEQQKQRLAQIVDTPAVTQDGQCIELLANIEQPADTAAALAAGAAGVGLLRSEFLFMGRSEGRLPDEEEQYAAYYAAVQGMRGRPVTIRTVDVGADKPLDTRHCSPHQNPAMSLRAIRWSLSEPAMFLAQLRAILRAAAHGPVQMLIPMLAHGSEIRQTLELIARARAQLQASGQAHGPCAVGAMIEIPAAALTAPLFLRHFDFLSIGTNDLVQYTLAIDRTDPAVAHLYDPLHPAVLRLIADTIAAGRAHGKPVCVCGEMAGDAAMTALLLGLGLRSFSMHPARILAVKQHILQSDISRLTAWAQAVVASDDPAQLLAQQP